MNDISNAICEVYNAFCKQGNVIYGNRQERSMENRKSMDIIANKLQELPWDNIVKIAAFPDERINEIAKTLHSGRVISAEFKNEIYYANSEMVMPATLYVTVADKNSTKEIQFSDNIYNPLISPRIPLSMNENGEICGNLETFKMFSKTISVNGENPAVGYLQTDGISMPARPVRIDEINQFILPSGEQYTKAKFNEYVSFNKDAFENAVAAKMLVHGLMECPNADMVSSVQNVLDLYQVGIAESNEGMQDAMKCTLKAFSMGYEKNYETYIFPSTSDIMDGFINEGIDGPYNIKTGQGLENISVDNSYSVDIEVNEIDIECCFA